MRRSQRRLIAVAVLSFLPLLAAPLCAGEGGRLRLSPDLHELEQFAEHARTYRMMLIMFQVAAILAAAKLLGWVCERISVPGVIGELLAGTIFGPYLLGSLIAIPMHGHWAPLFPRPLAMEQWPVNDAIWAMAQFASVVLLFTTGLHTDLKQFLRYMGPASLIAVAGLVVPFALGIGVVYLPFFADVVRSDGVPSVFIPALFVGAILAATSIGITARVLSDIGRLDTPEGVSILGAAVLDDVLGIIALAIVGGIASAGSISIEAVGMVAAKALGFWLGLTALVLLLARPLEKLITRIRYAGATIGLALAIGFALSGAAEGFGLAFIIGAYSVGLGLSRTKMSHDLMEQLQPVENFIVPIFFATIGMLVDLRAMVTDWRVITFGLAVTIVAIVGKLFGCGAAASAGGFNLRGAYRIGVGMMPRGEVALIVAGIGLSRRIIQESVFGVSIMMTLLTTVLGPLLLVKAFAKGGTGRRKRDEHEAGLPAAQEPTGLLVQVTQDMAEPLLMRLVTLASDHGWEASYEQAEQDIYLLRCGDDAAQISRADGILRIDTAGSKRGEFRTLLEQARRSLMDDAGRIEVRETGG